MDIVGAYLGQNYLEGWTWALIIPGRLVIYLEISYIFGRLDT